MKKILFKISEYIHSVLKSMDVSNKIMISMVLMCVGDILYQYCLGNIARAIDTIQITIFLVIIFASIMAYEMMK